MVVDVYLVAVQDADRVYVSTRFPEELAAQKRTKVFTFRADLPEVTCGDQGVEFLPTQVVTAKEIPK